MLKEPCFYVPGARNIIDAGRVLPDGSIRGYYSNETPAEIAARHPGAVLIELEDAAAQCHAAARAAHCTGPVEIDRERFDYLLEVLPPSRWTRAGDCESFHVCERITSNIVTWAVRRGARYFEINEEASKRHPEIMALVDAAFPNH